MIIGDSRVVRIRDAKIDEGGWYLRHKLKSGATLDTIEKMLEEVYNEARWTPQAVVICGLMTDVVKRTKTEKGILMELKEEVLDNNYKEYPNLQGVEKRVEKVQNLIKAMWGEAEIFWILPYPIDFVQYNNIKKIKQEGEPMNIPTEQEKKRDLSTTYNGYLYFKALEEMLEEKFGIDNTMRFRRHCEATLKPNMMNTSMYMQRVMEGNLKIGRLYPAGLVDGLHTYMEPAQMLVEEILWKVNRRLRPATNKLKLKFIKKKEEPQVKSGTTAEKFREDSVESTNLKTANPLKVFASIYVPEEQKEKLKSEEVISQEEVTIKPAKPEYVSEPKLNIPQEKVVKEEVLKTEKEELLKVQEEETLEIKEEETSKLKEDREVILNEREDETTLVELVKYPCGHICLPAVRGWWRMLKCSECGGRWSTEEGEVTLETLTTVIHHVRLNK